MSGIDARRPAQIFLAGMSRPARACRLKSCPPSADGLPMRPWLGLLIALCCCLPPACTSSREDAPVNADTALVQRLHPQRAWRVLDGGQIVGFVICFVDPRLATRCSYSVRNTLHQELGTIDELGRAWRFVPHQREAEWVTTSTVTLGSARILGASESASLEVVDLDELRRQAPPALDQ